MKLDLGTKTDYISDKRLAINTYCKSMLTRTISMFTWKGFPDTVNTTNLEYYLQVNGSCIIANHENRYLALDGTYAGQENEYHEPDEYTVTNTALHLSKTYVIDKDAVVIRNDIFNQGLLPIFKKYGSLLAENMISLRLATINLRQVNRISVNDDSTLTSAKQYLSDIEKGKLGVISRNPFFENITQPLANIPANYITQLIELHQYLRASAFNEIGLNSNYNMKRARLISGEIDSNESVLMPLVESMLDERKKACSRLFNIYGLHVSVDFSGEWKRLQDKKEGETDESKKLFIPK